MISELYRKKTKKTRIALKSIFGIGPYLANHICDTVGISTQKVQNLTSSQLDLISKILTNNYFFGHELKQIINTDIKRLKNIKSFRGILK